MYYHPKEFFFSEIKPRGVFPKENIFYHVEVLSRNGAFANEMVRICFCCLLVNRQHFNSIFVKWNNRHPLTSTKNKINSNPFPRRTRDEKFELPRTHTTILRMGTVSIRHFFLKTEKEKGGPFFPFTPAFLFGGFIDGRAFEECRIQHYSTYYNDGRKPSLTGPFQLSESLWSKSIATPYSTGLRAYFTFCSAFLWSFPYLPICGTFWRGSKQILLANPSNTCVSWASFVYYCGEPQNNTSKAVNTMVL